jgi:hypothetical protein
MELRHVEIQRCPGTIENHGRRPRHGPAGLDKCRRIVRFVIVARRHGECGRDSVRIERCCCARGLLEVGANRQSRRGLEEGAVEMRSR